MSRPKGDTLAAVVRERATTSPSHTAILFGDMRISYGELLERSEAAAKGLLALDVASCDRVGALLGNDPDWVVMALAASMIGATFVPLNTWYKASELRWTIRHARLSLIVAARRHLKTDYARVLCDLIPELDSGQADGLRSTDFPSLRAVVFIGEAPSRALDWPAFLKRGTDIPTAYLRAVSSAVDPLTPAYVLYTSGSTAEPKGVLLNHRGVVRNGFDLGRRRGIDSDDRVWLGSPLFYALGATNALPATFTAGAALVLQGAFEPGAAIEAVSRSQASVYYGTGNMSLAILGHTDYAQRKIGSLKKGNAGLGAEYKRLTLVEMGITGAVPAYGLTETYGNATVGEPDDSLAAKLAGNGRPLPGMEVVIVDPTTYEPLPKGQVGLVLVRGYTTPGYLDNPEETAKALRSNGFFDTGDLGALNGDEGLVFHARLKEVIKSGGINISPVEVEQLIVGHPDIRDAHVVGVSDPKRGELVVAFVDAFAPLTEQAVRDYVKERAAAFKAPHHVLFRKESQLPRLASGKISKQRLVEEARQELGLPS